ncbi:MAG: transporter [Bdellovibrionota bacterium]
MNKNKWLLLLGILGFTVSATAFSAGSSASLKGNSETQIAAVSSAPDSPLWKASASTYYYDFQGTREAAGSLYNFGSTSLLMQLVTLQYEVSPGWTILALGQHFDNYVETNMPFPGVGNVLFKDRTMGWGDVLIDAIHPLYLSSSFLLFGDIGASLPTGSINKKNPSNPGSNYAYNMQMGSGTFDAEVGAVAIYLNPIFQTGTHLSTYQRFGENRNDYRLGNLYKADAWFDVPVGLGFTPRLVGYYKVKTAIHNMDKTLGRNVYTEFYHHDQRNWDVSAAVKFEHGLFGHTSLMAEVGKPIYQGSQNVDRVVVSTNYYGTAGISGTF